MHVQQYKTAPVQLNEIVPVKEDEIVLNVHSHFILLSFLFPSHRIHQHQQVNCVIVFPTKVKLVTSNTHQRWLCNFLQHLKGNIMSYFWRESSTIEKSNSNYSKKTTACGSTDWFSFTLIFLWLQNVFKHSEAKEKSVKWRTFYVLHLTWYQHPITPAFVAVVFRNCFAFLCPLKLEKQCNKNEQ